MVWEPHIQAPAGGLEPGGRVEGSHGCRGGVRSGLRPLRSAGTFPSASVHPASGGRKLHGGFLCYQILGVTACGQVLLLMIIPDLQQPLEQKDLHQKIAETVFPLASESQVSLEPIVTLLCTAPRPSPSIPGIAGPHRPFSGPSASIRVSPTQPEAREA